ncbi:E3 ubiquitin-protein ligase rnf152 [Denticeps clupeoides]|uniref:E3 ubiquitin-protein ligase rnf152 n=1 Tax=Denticeps clupeoides TaxID=299321 RepID=UPI0010A314E8|nr:E3 ubiquitin-protein ligase rnf152-like [Denticeps clupeoides]
MGSVWEDSQWECQICCNRYSHQRALKPLGCQHVCCSACLTQIRKGQNKIRCPWCRCVTDLASGLSESQLSDDPRTITLQGNRNSPADFTHTVAHLPSHDDHLSLDNEVPLLWGEFMSTLRADGQLKDVTTVTVSHWGMLGSEERRGQMKEDGRAPKRSLWTNVCTMMLVAFLLFFLLGVILHNVFCVPKRFTIISCG